MKNWRPGDKGSVGIYGTVFTCLTLTLPSPVPRPGNSLPGSSGTVFTCLTLPYLALFPGLETAYLYSGAIQPDPEEGQFSVKLITFVVSL